MKSNRKGTIGIIGGMGPAATALLFEKIVQFTDASCDAEHIRILIDNNPFIPDRTKAILEGNDAPVPPMVESGKMLEEMGATVLIFPCNTAHYFFDRIQGQLGVPIIHMVRETAALCKRKNYQRVAILGTDGTVKTQIYTSAMRDEQIEAVYPSPEGQRQVVHIIYDQVKAGKSVDLGCVEPFLAEMTEAGVEAFVLACTELSIAFHDCGLPYSFIDSMDALAMSAIVNCGYHVREEYR